MCFIKNWVHISKIRGFSSLVAILEMGTSSSFAASLMYGGKRTWICSRRPGMPNSKQACWEWGAGGGIFLPFKIFNHCQQRNLALVPSGVSESTSWLLIEVKVYPSNSMRWLEIWPRSPNPHPAPNACPSCALRPMPYTPCGKILSCSLGMAITQ